MRRMYAIMIVMIIGMSSCDTNPHLVNCDFDEQAMLTNYADNIIIPRFDELRVGTLLLESSVQAFLANPTPDLLVEIRVAFAATYLAYQACSPFAFGPGLINGVPFRERMNTFPTNSSAILDNIAAGTSVANSSISTVGFPAVEYLIFGTSGTSTSELVDLFTIDTYAAARRNYLSGLVTELRVTADQITTGWSTTGGNFRAQFISNTGTAGGSSISSILNEMNYDFETLKNFKFKIPLGKLNGGVIIPESVEAYYSGGSMQLAVEQAIAFQELYLGVGSNSTDGLGLYEYLVCLETEYQNTSLADTISSQFESIIDHMNQVPDPLSETLSNNKPVVDAAYQQMQMMVPLLKYEMTTAMGVQISYQDNDGD